MCYVGASTAAWQTLYPERDFVGALHHLWSSGISATYGVPGGIGPFGHWSYDQVTLTSKIQSAVRDGAVLLESHSDEELGFKRLCRQSMGLHHEAVRTAGVCTDYHMVRDCAVDSLAATVLQYVQ